jgi:polyvinyl alcohol dehydrogenase (cytochrome)
MAGGRAPPTFFLKRRLPSEIVYALTKGAMRAQGAGLSPEDINAVARSLTGREIDTLPPADANLCKSRGNISLATTEWASWGQNTHNSRFQPAPGLTAADLPRLKVKWAFALPGLTGAPTVAGDYLFVTSLLGKVFALDSKTGCTRWAFDAGSPVKNGVAIGRLPDGRYGAFFGDQRALVHALDATTGKPLWSVRTDDYGNARIVGSITFHKGVVYAPTTSADEVDAFNPAYECCKFRGSVTAIQAATGQVLWKSYPIQEAPHPTRKNDAGTQMYGPSGAGVWSAPTVDEKRGLIYAATGDAYTTDVPTDGSDAVVAFDMKTGKRVWVSQVLEGDAWIYGCDPKTNDTGENKGPGGNCPTPQGPDHDLSSPPLLTTMADGKDILLSGSKSGRAWAFDPDAKGKILWSTAIGKGSTAFPMWGIAADSHRAYVATPTLGLAEGQDGGFSGLDLKTGKIDWHIDSPAQPCAWGTAGCQHKQTAAVTLIPGIALAGSMDGHLRAYDTETGKIVWDYDSAGTWDAVNGVKAYGGNLDGAPQIVAKGVLFLSSGNSALPSPHHGDAVLAITVDGK